MRLLHHRCAQFAKDLPRPLRVGIRQGRALHRLGAKVIELGLVARQAGHDLSQAGGAAELAVQQCDQMQLCVQLARQVIGAVLLNRLIELVPRQVLQGAVKYDILMQHDVRFLPCLDRVRSDRSAEESTSCTLSTKIEPDSRGSSPAMTIDRSQQVEMLSMWSTGPFPA